MPYTKKQHHKDKKEIKLYYKLFFAEKNKQSSSNENWECLSKANTQFSGEILEDLQNRNLSEDVIEKINTALEKGELYFNIYRDDEDKIPKDAFLLPYVRMLSKNGLLKLEIIIQDTLSQWIPKLIKQAATTAMDVMSTWLSSATPSLKVLRDKTWTDMNLGEWKDYIDENEAEKENEEKHFESIDISESESKEYSKDKYYFPFQQLMSSAWQLASYITQHPLKAMTLTLATQVVMVSALDKIAKFSSSTQDIEAPSSKPNSNSQLRTHALDPILVSQKSIFSAEIPLSSLNGLNGFMISQTSRNYLVAKTGDINGDGKDDILLGYRTSSPGSISDLLGGVIFGTGMGYPAMFIPSALTLNGANGFQFTGPILSEISFIDSFSDMNGDGLADIVLRVSSQIDATAHIFVIFGKRSGWPTTFPLFSLNGTNGFELLAASTLTSIQSCGDINGDGIIDIIVIEQSGTINVVLGQRVWPATFALSSLNGTNGFKLIGFAKNSQPSLSSTGDINGDGLTDILIGAPHIDIYTGAAFVVLGKRENWPAVLTPSNLNGINGFKIAGEKIYDSTGYSVCNAGDINGDGLTDMVIGNNKGGCVIFGQQSGWPAIFAISSLNGTNGFKFGQINGLVRRVSVCDINGDGLTDIISEAEGDTNYIIFGQRNGWPIIFALSGLNGRNGFRSSGWTRSSVGDFNNDGIMDLVFSTYQVAGGVIFGRRGPWPTILVISTLNGVNGFKFVGDSPFFSSAITITNAGDIDGDGIADLLLNLLNSYYTGIVFGTPIALCNQLTINQNQSIVLDSSNLYATYRGELRDFFFNVTAIQNGQFYWLGTSKSLTLFRQQNVTKKEIQFKANDSTYAPQYNLQVILNGITQGNPLPSLITYYRNPVLTRNYIVINQGQTIVLTPNNLSVTDSNPSVVLGDLIFDFSSITHGFFSFITFPQNSIKRFTQRNITSLMVQFTHDNSIFAPSYFFTMTDPYGTRLNLVAGIVDFDATPLLITNELKIKQSQKIIFSSNELKATHEGVQKDSLLFIITNLAHGNFYYHNNPNVFLSQFYQKDISNALVVFEQAGTIKAPQYQISVSDGRTTSGYEQAKISFQLTPDPASISTQNSKASSDDFLIKSLLSGAISGLIGLGFLAAKIYLSHKAQKKLNQIIEEKEGVGKDLAEYRNNVIRPVARTIFERVKLSGCLSYVSDETMTDYLSAIETLVSALSHRGVLEGFDALSIPERHRIIHEVAKQTKQVLVPTIACCSSANLFRFFRPDITPGDIEKNAGKIIDSVVTALQESVMAEDAAQELDTMRTHTRPNVSGEGDILLRPLLGPALSQTL